MKVINSKYGNYNCPLCGQKMAKSARIAIGDWLPGWSHENCAIKGQDFWLSAGEGSEATTEVIDEAPSPVNKFDVSGFNYSPEQLAHFELVKSGRNVLVDAGAGCAKTFSIIHSVVAVNNSTVGRPKKFAYLAFNKPIVNEMEEKINKLGINNLSVFTSHSGGFRAYKKATGSNVRVNIDQDKVYNIITSMTPGRDSEEVKARNELKKLVSLFKNTMDDLESLIIEHELDLDMSYVDKYFNAVLDKANSYRQKVDFDDMLYYPVIHGASWPYYDTVFVDECQDLNNTQLKMIEGMRYKQIVFVGDPQQAIYAFRGANSECFPEIRKRFKTVDAKLSVTFRCPKAVVELVNKLKLKEGFTAHPDAIDGEIITTKEFNPEPGDLVMSRLRAPILPAFYELVQKDIPCRIIGKDFGGELTSLIKGFNANDFESLERELDKWEDKQIKRINRSVKDPEARSARIETVTDKGNCIKYLMAGVDSVYDLLEKIAALFDNQAVGDSVAFSTVHGAKGLEAKTCWILSPDKMPLYDGGQENNILYVCLTRVQDKLVYVERKVEE